MSSCSRALIFHELRTLISPTTSAIGRMQSDIFVAVNETLGSTLLQRMSFEVVQPRNEAQSVFVSTYEVGQMKHFSF